VYYGTLQLGPNHVCVILSHRRDTSFEASFRHRNKYLADVLSLNLCKSMHIRSKFHFENFFGAKKFSSFFGNLEFLNFTKYHVSVILSQRRDTLYFKVSHRRDSITSV